MASGRTGRRSDGWADGRSVGHNMASCNIVDPNIASYNIVDHNMAPENIVDMNIKK